MIAHRLQTIITAQNLLYIEDSKTMLAGAKGTKEYEDIMHKLQEQNYKHQREGGAAGEKGGNSNIEEEEINNK